MYVPSAQFNGTDSFTYQISDGTLTDTATVSITVSPVIGNTPPLAEDDFFSWVSGMRSKTGAQCERMNAFVTTCIGTSRELPLQRFHKAVYTPTRFTMLKV